MPAIRIIDDHVELANIGTNTHAQIDTHIADPSAHHTKYTDAEAVTAVATADDYVKNYESDQIDGELTVLRSVIAKPNVAINAEYAFFRFYDQYNNVKYQMATRMGTTAATQNFYYYDYYQGRVIWRWVYPYIDLNNNILQNPKNHAATALSGTKKLVEINIGAQSYYFEVYPTKA